MAIVSLRILQEWKAMRQFKALDRTFRELVFYSEGSGDWPHLGPVIERLLRVHHRKLSYLTSDPGDPGLRIHDDGIRTFLIGAGTVRTILFRSINCSHFIMTLPDLETFHLKRSLHPVHYVYLFHSINSTHTVYRKGAFDAYDTILCVGPHHVDEIRRTEAVYRLSPKELVEHGSVKLDSIIAQFENFSPPAKAGPPREILIAPSWGESSLIENPIGVELIRTLLDAGYRTVLRLHPMTVRRLPELVPALRKTFRDYSQFTVEDDMNATESWMRADAMVSDWSGAAIEFGFALQKPVIYINTQQKVNNPEWEKIGAPPFEDRIRYEIGQVVTPAAINEIPGLIESCCLHPARTRESILKARANWIYNIGTSSAAGAEYLASLVTGAD